jgi:hypothetical protein
MKKLVTAVMLSALVAIASVASAEIITTTATIEKITVAADGKSAAVVVKDAKGSVTVNVTDAASLEKLADKRITVGDEMRIKYDNAAGNAAKTFVKKGGC